MTITSYSFSTYEVINSFKFPSLKIVIFIKLLYFFNHLTISNDKMNEEKLACAVLP